MTILDAGGQAVSTIVSAFSEPGPIWRNFSAAPVKSAAHAPYWRVVVDHSKSSHGIWTVTANATNFGVSRVVALDPPPPARPRRVLFNDTFFTSSTARSPEEEVEGSRGRRGGVESREGSAHPSQLSPFESEVVGIFVRHTAYVGSSESDVAAALVPGAFGVTYCGTEENPGDTCARPHCLDRDPKDQNNGRPDVFVNLTSGVGLGLTALDDVFRVHAQTHQYAKRAVPRFASRMNCEVSSPPSIELRDPHLTLLAAADTYTAEWAAYVFERPSCTDYYCFVNAQRRDLATDTIPMRLTGALWPPDSTRGDTTIYNGTGFSSCFDPAVPNTKAQKAKMAKTCWEHWSPATFLQFLEQQTGPGGFVHIDNEDMLYDGNCSQLTIDGNRFVDALQRPAAFDAYYHRLVNQTAAANALLPQGAPRHSVIMYTDNFISTGVNDTSLFADSIIHGLDGAQQVYINCTKAGGPKRTQLPLFYADGTNSFSPILERYFELAFDLGAGGIFHDEFPLSAFAYTYLTDPRQRWDGRSCFLNTTTLAVRAVVSSLVLLTQPQELRLLDIVRRRRGLMIMNGAPQTRSWIEAVLSSPQSAPINENENSEAFRAHHSQLYTPMMLTRYGGNLFDVDPLYNHTHCCGNDRELRRQFMTAPCLSVSEHLDFGTLSMGYNGLWKNGTGSNIFAQMVPTTAVEIGEGFIIGLERTITKISGIYRPHEAATHVARSVTYLYDDCLLSAPPSVGGLEVHVQLLSRQIAVIVWLSETE